MMQVTMVTRETPEVKEIRTEGTFPVVVEADGLTMLLAVEHAEELAEKLAQVAQAIREAESEGPLPEYSPVRE